MKLYLISILTVSFFTVCKCRAGSFTDDSPVRIWEEKTVMPTYLVDPPDLNPRFYEGRAYQGAQGRIYPYPIYESLSNTRVGKEYTMVCLENEYIKVEVLPEIGGRVFGAMDKTNGYTYIYRQHVIKPALIGMLGAWISGGIEWNFPHHHRATAFMPVEYQMEKNEDGSATLWISELEIRHRMNFKLGITVYPGKSYFEVTFRPYNRTPFINSFLYFANTGVHTSKEYQVIFPPDTEFGVYHGKNQFIGWPISHEVYNSVDYTQGVDVSWWENHPEWTSIFAWNDEDDFVAGYDHGIEAGTLLYSNHHIAPGKKFWTWSTGPRGKLWDEALTETDGPELELMIGGYSDNQPDYSWMQPFESKYLKQYWIPVRNIGGIKNANLEASVNIEFLNQGEIFLAFNTTSLYQDAVPVVLMNNKEIYRKIINIDPAHPFSENIRIKEPYNKTDVRVALISGNGDTLITYQPKDRKNSDWPETAKPPALPSEIQSVEELYLAGQRLEQFYNPSLDPLPYYEEALQRDPGNYRVNIALGINYLRKGKFEEAEKKLQNAVNRISSNHTKPRDGEAYYYLGLTQKYQRKLDEAYKNLYQATWSYAFHNAAYYLLAEIDCINKNYDQALAHLDRAISTNSKNFNALNLKTSLLRLSGNFRMALTLNEELLSSNPLDFRSMYENYLLSGKMKEQDKQFLSIQEISNKMRDYRENYLELSLEYGICGLWNEAVDVLGMIENKVNTEDSKYPMIYYYLAWYHHNLSDQDKADNYLKMAADMPPDYCFPFRLESIEILEFAMERNPRDGKAPYYLGNLLFEWQPERAIKAWKLSVDIDDQNPVAFRNLGMAYNKQGNNDKKSLEAYGKAIALKGSDQRLLFEQDLIMAANRVDPKARLKILEDHHTSIANNNVSDALSREVMLYVQLGQYDKALKILDDNYFRQWEGVSKAYDSFVNAHLLKGLGYYDGRYYKKALNEFQKALEYPENMMVAQPYRGGRECQVYYYIGLAQKKMGLIDLAESSFDQSANQRLRPDLSDLYYYRGMSLLELEKSGQADEIFGNLIQVGNDRLKSHNVDFFAKFGEKETPEDKASEAWYLIGLGYLGKGEKLKAGEAFRTSVELNINHTWSALNLNQLK